MEVRVEQTCAHASPLGPLTSQWTERGLYRLEWNADGSPTADVAPQQGPAAQLDELLQAYFRRGDVSMEGIDIDPSGWSEFTSAIYQRCRQIAPGETLTYRQLAESVSDANASRAVGAAMARNRVLIVIPCHRVLSTDGQLRRFSAPGGLSTKQDLLDLERARQWPRTLFAAPE